MLERANLAGFRRPDAEIAGIPAALAGRGCDTTVARRMLVLGDMEHLGWRPPVGRVDAETARRSVLAQHARIRALLEKAHGLAESALDGESPAPDAVASAIGDIRTTVEVHLSFEEGVLLPILRDDPPLGPERADRLMAEHLHQREVLATLHAEASAGPDRPTLAAKLEFLTRWLLEDMGHEEESLLTPDVIRDDTIAIDQSDG